MGLGQVQGGIEYPVIRRYYTGTSALQPGNTVAYDLDPTYNPSIPAWDPSRVPGWDPEGTSQPTIDGARNVLGHAVMDIPANGLTYPGIVAATAGTAGTANINSCAVAGVIASAPSLTQPNIVGTNTNGPYYVDIVELVTGRVIPILISYNNALPGDLVMPDEATPSNTFVPAYAAGGTSTIPVNVGTSATFAAQNSAGTLGALTGSIYPSWKDLCRAKLQILMKGNTSGNSATAPQLVLAKVV